MINYLYYNTYFPRNITIKFLHVPMDDRPFSLLKKILKIVGFCIESQGSFLILGKIPLTFNNILKIISTYQTKGKNSFVVGVLVMTLPKPLPK